LVGLLLAAGLAYWLLGEHQPSSTQPPAAARGPAAGTVPPSFAGAPGATIHLANSPTGRGARATADGISAITCTDGSGPRRTRGRTTDTASWWAISITTSHSLGATGPNRITERDRRIQRLRAQTE
jgi:hypothetical protein